MDKDSYMLLQSKQRVDIGLNSIDCTAPIYSHEIRPRNLSARNSLCSLIWDDINLCQYENDNRSLFEKKRMDLLALWL
jgi:hypothetical protein